MRLAVHVINRGSDVKLFAHLKGQFEGQIGHWQLREFKRTCRRTVFSYNFSWL
jgi:hypothetical protein